MPSHVFNRPYSCLRDSRSRIRNQIAHQPVEHALQGFIELQLLGRSRIQRAHCIVRSRKDLRAFRNLVNGKQMRFAPIVQVGGVIGDFVGQVDDLGLKRRPQL